MWAAVYSFVECRLFPVVSWLCSRVVILGVRLGTVVLDAVVVARNRIDASLKVWLRGLVAMLMNRSWLQGIMIS